MTLTLPCLLQNLLLGRSPFTSRHATAHNAGVVWQQRMPEHDWQPAHLLQHRHLGREPADRVRTTQALLRTRATLSRLITWPASPAPRCALHPARDEFNACPAVARSMWVNLILGIVIYLGFVAFRGMKGFEFYHARLVRPAAVGFPAARRGYLRSAELVAYCGRAQWLLIMPTAPQCCAAAAGGVAQAAAAAAARPPAVLGLAAAGVQGDGRAAGAQRGPGRTDRGEYRCARGC